MLPDRIAIGRALDVVGSWLSVAQRTQYKAYTGSIFTFLAKVRLFRNNGVAARSLVSSTPFSSCSDVARGFSGWGDPLKYFTRLLYLVG